MAHSSLTADVAVSAAAFVLARARRRYQKWTDSSEGNPDGITDQLAKWCDAIDAEIEALQARGAVGATTALITRTTQAADSQDEGSPWEEATKTITVSIPAGEILIGVGLTIGTAFVSGSGDTTQVTVVLGINGGDTDRGAESVNLIGASAGALVWPAGVGIGEVIGSGTWQLLFTATGGDPSLADLTSGTLTATVLTVPR